MKIPYDWLPQDFTIEFEDDHLLYLKHKGNVVGVYNQTTVTLEILKEDVKIFNEETKNLERILNQDSIK